MALVLRPVLSEHAEEVKYERLKEKYETEMSGFYLPIRDTLLMLSQSSKITKQTYASAVNYIRKFMDLSTEYFEENNLSQYMHINADGTLPIEGSVYNEVYYRQVKSLSEICSEILEKVNSDYER